MSQYSQDNQTYCGSAVEKDSRYSSVGVRAYPECVDWYRKEVLLDQLRKISSEFFDVIGGQKVLNGGCVTGIYSDFYADQGAKVTGIDVSQEAVNEVKSLGIKGEYRRGSIDDIPTENCTFDLTRCFSILYHIIDGKEWSSSVSEPVRTTRPGGIIVLRIEWREETARSANHVKLRKPK
jgi:2-polyprenyl-3-methyl-5-hydroxy-6-metoxy-1,4-benzoquinol methylase